MYRGERFNAYSHLIGAILALTGMVWLLVHSSLYSNVWKIVSSAIYGSALVLVYTVSTIYHSVRGRAKAIFQRLDHCVIYLLIAGSYTPFALTLLRGPWGWSLFGISWGLAIVGIVQEVLIGKRTQFFSMLIYVVMGWLILVALKPLTATLSTAGLAWLAAGGVIYTLGIVFFLLDTKVKHFHGVWHLFVLAGSICQFISIMFYTG